MSSINLNSTSMLVAQRIFKVNTSARANSLLSLSTGLRINRAKDDPAGLITSENLRATLKALEAESRAAQRAEDVINVAEGALSEVSGLLNEARGLVVENANSAGLSDAEREANQMELDSILSTVNRISAATSFNGERLLDGNATFTVNRQSITIDGVSTGELGETTSGGETYTLSDVKSGGRLNILTGDLALADQVLSVARTDVAKQRGALGAFTKNNIGSHLNRLSVTSENLASAESRIRDTDYAAQSSDLARLSVLVQTARDAILQTGSAPRSVLNLLA